MRTSETCILASMRKHSGWPLCLTLCFILFSPSIAGDAITPSESLGDGETLSSAGGIFELGFFSPGNSKNRYLGIWFKSIPVQTVVWVANRDRPIANTSGLVKLRANGTLLLLDQSSSAVVWSSNGSGGAPNPVAQLLDSGNLVVRRADSRSFAWQSFDCPGKTLLAGMKLSLKSRSPCFTTWKNEDDPSPGNYFAEMDPHGDIVVWRGSERRYRTGPWNGLRFSGVPEMKTYDLFVDNFVSERDETYYEYELNSSSVLMQVVLNEMGVFQRLVWNSKENTNTWKEFWSAPKDQCDLYGNCGPYGVCNTNDSPVCSCLDGFQPKSPQEWYQLRDGSNGCTRKTQLNCSGDGFRIVPGMKLPEMSSSTVNKSMSLDECRDVCLKNCSCTAYACANVSTGGGTGCITWAGELVDLREYTDGGQDLYIRLAASDLDNGGNKNKKKQVVVAVTVSLAVGMLLLILSGCCMWKKKKKKKKKRGIMKAYDFNESREKDMDLPLFNFDTIATATDNFSVQNKLGQGGFGPVYKGKLKDGQEIAVKRLSKYSVQGVDEFKNEVGLIVKLQHRNLVRLLGCCIEGEERMLVYEYMPNKSLDAFIFEREKAALLDWRKRPGIILGIARGLLYLHQDSRLRIIHRDLKASNILLDLEMNPKISDFGTARIFGGEEMEENTRKVVGTYGYMSPEYAMDGKFSVKSDVFSFGVLLLEIVSGKKNRGIYYSDPHSNLVGHAWRLWNDGNFLELLDESIGYSYYPISEVTKCMQIGLLCVQERAEDRPAMPSVVLMLCSNSVVVLPQPKRPGFFAGKSPAETDCSSTGQETCTASDMTVTILEGR